MEVKKYSIPERVYYNGEGKFEMLSGDKLSVKASNDEKIKMTVPTGKRWRVTVQITIDEFEE